MKNLIRFRLSTLLWCVAIAGVLLAWYVDHRRRDRDDIVGVWYYPTPDRRRAKSWETLTIRPDGTFTKHESRLETYHGTYVLEDDGSVTFHVTSKVYDDGS